MTKRFTATEKWDDPWFYHLPTHLRMGWIYLLDKCNHAGIYNVNYALMEFHLGNKMEPKDFNGRVVELSADKWFIPRFVEFQYGELNEVNRAHKSVIDILKREGACKGLIRSLQGRKEPFLSSSSVNTLKQQKFQPPTLDEVRAYAKEKGEEDEADRFHDYQEAKGWKVGNSPMKDWKASFRIWLRSPFRDQNRNGQEKNPNADLYAKIEAKKKAEKNGN